MQARLSRCGSSSSPASTARSRCSCQARPVNARHALKPRVRAVWTAAEADGAAPSSQSQQPEEVEFEGLLPEEDPEVPGTYFDAMNSQTKLGKAVRAAVEELEHLGDLEVEVLQQCDDLLKKLGMKGSIFGSAGPGAARQPAADEDDSSSSSSTN